MTFKGISIKNFRNFKNVNFEISNKNIFFGLNDIGKTNLLYALRYVFDKEIRKQNILDSDFHNKNVSEPIEILITVDIGTSEENDCQKLRARLKGAIQSNETKVYIKFIAEYDEKELCAIPKLLWGGNIDSLKEMKQRGYFYDIDYVFNVIYIDSYVDLYSLFKKNVTNLIKNEEDSDKGIIENINRTIANLNEQISSLSGIKEFENKIRPEYEKFRNEGIEILIKSEIAIKGLYSNIVPYIKQNNDNNLYPTAGEGRKKLLAYSIFDILSNESEETKINLFLIEEPENHLHRSMQISLSQILFTNSKYKYLFVTTHSPFILYEMDEVNLIRIYNEGKLNSSSTFYKVPELFKQNRKMLNYNLSEAIFANKVLLVEGPSEYALFNKILSIKCPFYESYGIYILVINGIGFEHYYKILYGLNIITIVKTDNDLKSCDDSGYLAIGLQRCNKFITDNDDNFEKIYIKGNSVKDKRKLYNENKQKIELFRTKYRVFLSKVDLENDLDEFMHERLCELLDNKKPVKYLQNKKHYNMINLIEKLTEDDCNNIYKNYNFECLEELLDGIVSNSN